MTLLKIWSKQVHKWSIMLKHKRKWNVAKVLQLEMSQYGISSGEDRWAFGGFKTPPSSLFLPALSLSARGSFAPLSCFLCLVCSLHLWGHVLPLDGWSCLPSEALMFLYLDVFQVSRCSSVVPSKLERPFQDGVYSSASADQFCQDEQFPKPLQLSIQLTLSLTYTDCLTGTDSLSEMTHSVAHPVLPDAFILWSLLNTSRERMEGSPRSSQMLCFGSPHKFLAITCHVVLPNLVCLEK